MFSTFYCFLRYHPHHPARTSAALLFSDFKKKEEIIFVCLR
jgi:hypothetical protein